jgi:DNA cross-link repair 1A protein
MSESSSECGAPIMPTDPLTRMVTTNRPTGWTFAGGATGSGRSYEGRSGNGPAQRQQSGAEKALGVNREERGSCVMYGVPYSEHSSFSELRGLVSLIKAQSIVPTVNCGSAEQRKSLVKLLTE